MAFYRCYVFDTTDDILAVEDIEGKSDADAIAKTRQRQSRRSAFELWERNRLIHRQDSPAASDDKFYFGQCQRP
jgi:hypothetical protein